MNKLMMAVVACAVFACGGAFADEKKNENLLEKPTGNPILEIEQQEKNDAIVPKKNVAMWPACFAVFELPETPDLVGIRFAIPYSTKQESVTGFDIGFWGRSRYFEGIAVNVFRNDVKKNFLVCRLLFTTPQAIAILEAFKLVLGMRLTQLTAFKPV